MLHAVLPEAAAAALISPSCSASDYICLSCYKLKESIVQQKCTNTSAVMKPLPVL